MINKGSIKDPHIAVNLVTHGPGPRSHKRWHVMDKL